MNCPYCGAELTCIDYYGKTQYPKHYWDYPHRSIEKIGDIFRCPNVNGFPTYEDVLEYIDGNEDDLEEYCHQHGILSWDEVVCESNSFHGYFYTDKDNKLCEGYPC